MRTFTGELMHAAGYLPDKSILELGSGGGFLKEMYPAIITSDVLQLPSVDKVFSATANAF